MAGRGPLTSNEVARRSECSERYVREWLRSQVAGGYLDYHPSSESFELTKEQAQVLAEEDSPHFVPHALSLTASMWQEEESALEAFRSGRGVSWGQHPERMYCGVAAFYRNAYSAQLVQTWLPALEGVVPALERGARVADGHSTILMAEAFPRSEFWGFDSHPESIEQAKRLAQDAGVADRVRFAVAKSTEFPAGPYDLICYFDCLHDMGHPDRALNYARNVLAKDGSVLLVEPFAKDSLEENKNPVSRLYYVGSTLLCCPHAVSESGDYVLGAQAGEGRLRHLAESVGFGRVRCAVATSFNLVLQLRP